VDDVPKQSERLSIGAGKQYGWTTYGTITISKST